MMTVSQPRWSRAATVKGDNKCEKEHKGTPFVSLSRRQFILSSFLHPPLSSSLSSAALGPLGTSGPPLKGSWHRNTGPVSLVMSLCFRGDRCVRSERTAVFVRKCLEGVRSPSSAQVLMAVRGVFSAAVFVHELSVCQWLSGESSMCVCVCVCK